LSNVTAIAAGEYHSLALKRDGSVVTWGDNSFSQSSVPAGLSNVLSVAAGYEHTLVVSAVSAATSTVTVASSVTYGSSTLVQLQLRDPQGTPLTHGGTIVTIGLGSGTSAGTLSSVLDVGNGTYQATFTATGVGTARTITATVNGQLVGTTLPA